jgi:hypothetical protein
MLSARKTSDDSDYGNIAGLEALFGILKKPSQGKTHNAIINVA